MNEIRELLQGLQDAPLYFVVLGFFAAYPVVSSVMWTSTAILYYVRRERKKSRPPEDGTYVPFVSILIAAYCEEANISETVSSCLRLDYPNFEVVVVDDGSTDRTAAIVEELMADPRLRLVVKEVNEGKAMALNDGLPCTKGEIVVVLDGDASPDEKILQHLVPHFQSARVAAVTGNPRVMDRSTFIAKLQILEFTSIVSLLRRAQRVWGRVLTMSGVVTALRKSAVCDVGLFSPDMATEDIDLTWKLQMSYYDIRYEPQAVVWMRVPTTLRQLWRQRRRWSLGLSQVLRRHGPGLLDWKRRRMWPVAVESVLSIVWAYCFVALSILWTAAFSLGVHVVGGAPIPNWWGMVIATMSLLQLATGVIIDRHYDKGLWRYYPVAVFYPLVYWMLMSIITVLTTPKGLFGRRSREPARWHTPRNAAAEPAQ
jgi:poly-beta-1,6-N-acetyl-D-glucosamine synthase